MNTIQYQCSSCGQEYTNREYRQLDRTPVDPDEDNPMEGQGYVRVCECGHEFHKDDWHVIETVEHDGREFRVSTTHLVLNHGHAEKDLWYETCAFWDGGSHVQDRYETQAEAENGHEEITDAIANGEFEVQDSQISTLSVNRGGSDA